MLLNAIAIALFSFHTAKYRTGHNELLPLSVNFPFNERSFATPHRSDVAFVVSGAKVNKTSVINNFNPSVNFPPHTHTSD